MSLSAFLISANYLPCAQDDEIIPDSQEEELDMSGSPIAGLSCHGEGDNEDSDDEFFAAVRRGIHTWSGTQYENVCEAVFDMP